MVVDAFEQFTLDEIRQNDEVVCILNKIKQDFLNSLSDNSNSILNYTKIFKSQKNFMKKLSNCKFNFDVLQNIVVNKLSTKEETNSNNASSNLDFKFNLIKQNMTI